MDSFAELVFKPAYSPWREPGDSECDTLKVMKHGLLLSLALPLTIAPMGAHHSFAAEYDAKAIVEFQGTVTKFEWTNPHAHFYVDVKSPDGKVANWNMELASPNMLVRNGWKRNSLKEGDQVHVIGARAKDGTATGSATTIKLPDGRTLTFMAAPEGPAPK
jgi:hypothetical protein